jgi:hypothetical protein
MLFPVLGHPSLLPFPAIFWSFKVPPKHHLWETSLLPSLNWVPQLNTPAAHWASFPPAHCVPGAACFLPEASAPSDVWWTLLSLGLGSGGHHEETTQPFTLGLGRQITLANGMWRCSPPRWELFRATALALCCLPFHAKSCSLGCRRDIGRQWSLLQQRYQVTRIMSPCLPCVCVERK